MHDTLLYVISAVIVLGALAQWLSWRLRLPAILALLVIGVVAGPVTGLLRPDEMFGDTLFPMVSLGVALVLFEGGLTLRFSDLRGHGAAVSNLVSWGALLNWVLIAGGCWLLVDFSVELALLFAALVIVTGPTVINPLLRTMRATPEVSQLLRWEGILIDPVGALLAVLVFQFIVAGNESYMLFLQSIAVGTVAGAVAALTLAFLIRRHWIPEYLLNVVALAWVVLAFATSNFLAHESGLLAVTIMGVWLANTRGVDMAEVLSFKESLSILIISMLFIVLGARTNPADIIATGWGGVAVLVVVLLARPIVVWVSTLGGSYNWRERALVAWVAPRGIVAAAVSSLFALRLQDAGYPDADLLVSYTFLVIIFTVVLQSLTARFVARALGLVEEDPRGILIVGANLVARTIGKALLDQGFRVKLTDTTWSEIQAARMDGLDTYYGEPVSAHADRQLELEGIGRLFAMSRRPALNTLSALKFKREFGRNRVFTLRTSKEKDASEKHRVAETYRAPRLFGEDVTQQKLASLIAQGAEIKATLLTENFNLADYQAARGKSHIPLFALDKNDHLRAFTDDYQPEVTPGWTLLSLVLPQQLESEKAESVQSAKTPAQD
ncbi:K(+)/H(+) antiporter NhaP2 [Halioglobus japonicus]|nr:K(+)/H(+) antiporter NhaP2 [Halioglobus japonicus]